MRALDPLQLADATRESYRSRIAAWLRWCNAHDLPPLAPRPRQLAAYVSESELGPATLRTTLAALAAAHAQLDLPDPTRARSVRLALERAAAAATPPSAGRGAATLMSSEQVMEAIEALPVTPRNNRNAALLLVAHESGLSAERLSELRWIDIDQPGADGDDQPRTLSDVALQRLEQIRPQRFSPEEPVFIGSGHGFRRDATAPLSHSQILRIIRAFRPASEDRTDN